MRQHPLATGNPGFDALIRVINNSDPLQVRNVSDRKPVQWLRRSGGIGRRAGFKIQCPYGHVGSSPTFGSHRKALRNSMFFRAFPLRMSNMAGKCDVLFAECGKLQGVAQGYCLLVVAIVSHESIDACWLRAPLNCVRDRI